MPFQLAIQQETQLLTLEGEVTIRQALDLAALLAEGLIEGMPITVDTQGLEDIDTCILQLMCSLNATVDALSFTSPSEVFIRAVERCGLRRELLAGQEGL
jgi:anti-anti-sigma regulatory factor